MQNRKSFSFDIKSCGIEKCLNCASDRETDSPDSQVGIKVEARLRSLVSLLSVELH